MTRNLGEHQATAKQCQHLFGQVKNMEIRDEEFPIKHWS